MSRNILPACAATDHAKLDSPAAPSPTAASVMENNHVHCQVVKRKHAQMQQEHDELKSLFDILATANTHKSLEIHSRIRAGQSPQFILQQLQHGDILAQNRINSERHVRHVLLSSLMQANASFEEMVDFVGLTVAKQPGTQIPTTTLLRQLRGKQTDIKGFRNLLGYPQSSPPQRRIAISDLLSDEERPPLLTEKSSPSEDEQDNNKKHLEPPIKVPAKPWTALTEDDDLVSHLISLWLQNNNPFFRVVEEDLFVKAMQSGDLSSEYCSPFLVNSILALACLYTKRQGQIRATANTILQPAWHTTCKEDLPTHEELALAKSSKTWTGYPYHDKNDYLDKDALYIAHCRLIQLTWKAQRILYASDRGDPQFFGHVEALTEEMNHWKDSLPDTLKFHGRMPAPVYDLYSCYASVIIALYSLFQPLGNARLAPSEETSQSRPKQGFRYHADLTPPCETSEFTEGNIQSHFARTMSYRAIAIAHEHAVRLASFRHHYGLKIAPPYFVQANGVVCFTLLRDLDNTASAAAFKEAFRCLLGAGMQLLWARETILEAVADTAWTKTDTEMLSSCWPNIAIAKDAKVGESVTMEDLIKKWESLAVDPEEGEGKNSG
ncbi:hypothetical protein E4T52_03464 [Aureobasidium sp. EXF-3400]|nr:hypothetical protein E4T51_02653 [Aureobasidium sp. EXF-12344]KAI4781596.1 hypothetical protein E4T52_03464 [Aureobasidium sp. EXF-3400]